MLTSPCCRLYHGLEITSIHLSLEVIQERAKELDKVSECKVDERVPVRKLTSKELGSSTHGNEMSNS